MSRLINWITGTHEPESDLSPSAAETIKTLSGSIQDLTKVLQEFTLYPPENIDNLPLRTDVVTGYRGYNIVWQKGRPVLMGGFSVPWYERTLEAECNGSAVACQHHLATLTPNCDCGIYGHSAKEVNEYRGWDAQIVAQCVAFGIVWPHTRGWRASYARIESMEYTPIENPPSRYELDLVQELERVYEVPVTVASPYAQTEESASVYPPRYRGGGVTQRPGPSYHGLWSQNQ